MPTTENQTREIARLNFRLPSEAKEKIERAAVVSGLTVTDFAINALVSSAEDVLGRHHITTLSDRDRDLFLAMLDADDVPNEALRSAAETHKRLITK